MGQSASAMKPALVLLLLLSCYSAVILPFADYQHTKPIIEKVGYTPNADLLKMVSGDQQQSMAAALIFKVVVYFGSLLERAENRVAVPADYPAMSRTIHSAVRLDPYNMDSYYFAQAILVWDVHKVQVANDLLENGMKYRDWDYQLPYFVGFNYGYFLKDYAKAALYYRRAAEISGNDLFANLAGRYLQESGQTDIAVDYLEAMAKGARNEAIRKSFMTRLAAFREVQQIEQARNRFIVEKGRQPGSIDELLGSGMLPAKPVDPYGGEFYLEADGKVRTTSKFAPGRDTDSKQ